VRGEVAEKRKRMEQKQMEMKKSTHTYHIIINNNDVSCSKGLVHNTNVTRKKTENQNVYKRMRMEIINIVTR